MGKNQLDLEQKDGKDGDVDSVVTGGNDNDKDKVDDNERLSYQSSNTEGNDKLDNIEDLDDNHRHVTQPAYDHADIQINEDALLVPIAKVQDYDTVTVLGEHSLGISVREEDKKRVQLDQIDSKETTNAGLYDKDHEQFTIPTKILHDEPENYMTITDSLVLYYNVNNASSRACKSILQVINQTHHILPFDAKDNEIQVQIEYFPKTYVNSRDCFGLFEERNFENGNDLLLATDRQQIEETMEFYFNIFEPTLQKMWLPYKNRDKLKIDEFDAQVEQSKKEIESCINKLEEILVKNYSSIFILGKEPSLVDYIFFSQFTDLYVFEYELYKDKQKYFRVKIWHDFCKQLEGLNPVINEFIKEIPKIQEELGIHSKYYVKVGNKAAEQKKRQSIKNGSGLSNIKFNQLSTQSKYMMAENEKCQCSIF